jgi:uncharacterized membrane protein
MTSMIAKWRLPFGLILLGAVPVGAAIFRAVNMASHPTVTAANERFVSYPVPILLHIYGAVPYVVLGALQFVPSLRRMRWHRIVGRLLIPCGLAVGVSGIWMTLRNDLPPADGPLLNVFRVFFATLMIIAILLGFRAIRLREIAQHRAWMMRAYAIAIATGTQAVYLTLGGLLFGPGVTAKALLMAAAWMTNLAIAELFIRGWGQRWFRVRRPAPSAAR